MRVTAGWAPGTAFRSYSGYGDYRAALVCDLSWCPAVTRPITASGRSSLGPSLSCQNRWTTKNLSRCSTKQPLVVRRPSLCSEGNQVLPLKPRAIFTHPCVRLRFGNSDCLPTPPSAPEEWRETAALRLLSRCCDTVS